MDSSDEENGGSRSGEEERSDEEMSDGSGQDGSSDGNGNGNLKSKEASEKAALKKAKSKKAKKGKTGVVYLSRIPPHLKPLKLRHLLSQYGEVSRVYLAPEGKVLNAEAFCILVVMLEWFGFGFNCQFFFSLVPSPSLISACEFCTLYFTFNRCCHENSS